MDVGSLIVAVAGVVFTGGAAVATGVQAREARRSRRDAEAARDEARLARDESVELTRQAVAQAARANELQAEQNRLAAAALPKKQVRYTISHRRGGLYVVENTGTMIARAVLLEGVGEEPNKVQPEETVPRDLTIGDALGFGALVGYGGGPPVLRISWLDEGTGERIHVDRTIR